MKQLIEDIAKALVDLPDQVIVKEVQASRSQSWSCESRPPTWERSSANKGRTARSIRTLLGAAGMKLNRRFTLEILE